MKDGHPLRKQGGVHILMSAKPEVATFLRILTGCTGLKRMVLYDYLFRRGFEAVFGVRTEDLPEKMTPLPPSVAAEHRKDPRKLAELICKGPKDAS